VPIWTSELADPNLRGAFAAVEFTLALTGSTMYANVPVEKRSTDDWPTASIRWNMPTSKLNLRHSHGAFP
jgi:hypothetical protein